MALGRPGTSARRGSSCRSPRWTRWDGRWARWHCASLRRRATQSRDWTAAPPRVRGAGLRARRARRQGLGAGVALYGGGGRLRVPRRAGPRAFRALRPGARMDARSTAAFALDAGCGSLCALVASSARRPPKTFRRERLARGACLSRYPAVLAAGPATAVLVVAGVVQNVQYSALNQVGDQAPDWSPHWLGLSDPSLAWRELRPRGGRRHDVRESRRPPVARATHSLRGLAVAYVALRAVPRARARPGPAGPRVPGSRRRVSRPLVFSGPPSSSAARCASGARRGRPRGRLGRGPLPGRRARARPPRRARRGDRWLVFFAVCAFGVRRGLQRDRRAPRPAALVRGGRRRRRPRHGALRRPAPRAPEPRKTRALTKTDGRRRRPTARGSASSPRPPPPRRRGPRPRLCARKSPTRSSCRSSSSLSQQARPRAGRPSSSRPLRGLVNFYADCATCRRRPPARPQLGPDRVDRDRDVALAALLAAATISTSSPPSPSPRAARSRKSTPSSPTSGPRRR